LSFASAWRPVRVMCDLLHESVGGRVL